MANPVKIVAEENVVALFRSIMRPRQLRSEDIKGNEKIDIHGRGEYTCKTCENDWFSYFSWITVDLKEKRISKRWMMKCRECEEPKIPYFEVDYIKQMIIKAVDIYKGEYVSNKNAYYRYQGERRPPHLNKLCEKCKWGCEKCWEYRYRRRQ